MTPLRPVVAALVAVSVLAFLPLRAPCDATTQPATTQPAPPHFAVLHGEDFRHYIDELNQSDPEDVHGAIADAQSWDWMMGNVPFFACPDPDVQKTYYYRWWAYRKHIEQTPVGFVVTEFLRPVKHATQYNAISCALGLHIAEGRWLRDPRYIDQYANFWLHSGDNGGLQKAYHQFSGWTADALFNRWLVNGDTNYLVSQLDALVADYRLWETQRLTDTGLFWQRDVSDGMESSISGGRKVRNIRPSINSYLFADARAIAAIARLAGNDKLEAEYAAKAETLRQLVEQKLWNPQDQFFETVLQAGGLANVREEIGFTPWLFNLPEAGRGYEQAWKQLTDPKGFYAPFGPTTAEQRNPQFQIAETGDDCQWNGPSWPFATSITLSALANVLDGPAQDAVSRDDYWKTFLVYTHSQTLKRDDGTIVPWIDENLNPFTGIWQARSMKIRKKTFYGRGDHYNHSSYADLIITGVAGLRPRADNTIEVNPLAPENTWDWFALDAVPYHGHQLAIVWDKTGSHFNHGAGLSVYCDGKLVSHADQLQKLTGSIAN